LAKAPYPTEGFSCAGQPRQSLTRPRTFPYGSSMNPSEKCPFCASPRIVSGKMVAEDYGGYFEPDGIRPPGWRKATGIGTCVPTNAQSRACLQCGKVWGELDPAELQNLLSKYASGEPKAHVGHQQPG
jgi:hypothetical protein